ncbi:hypothetical protein HW555_011022 [Spodoptera exigua]|uniref:Uncharacterized protein n=1 Tax=Spodoptera exigua TaxID=7107 RepID=A0A835G7Z0_SPOEX|nr:hypothetical protein HW555_011022 [Spodoptera exigua]
MLRKFLFSISSVVYNNTSHNFSNRRFVDQLRTMKIGTHDGVFHCDEVLACYMLKLLPQYKDAVIVRTRDMAKLKDCDIVVDVGAVFDHEKKKYDHHQREFNETLSSLRPELGDKYKIKLSSAGLVYTYYGKEIIKQLVSNDVSLTPNDLDVIYRKVYENIIEEIDAIDNGIPICSGEPSYKIQTNLSRRVGRLNPEWNSKQLINMDEVFEKALLLVSEEFLHTVNYYVKVWLPARVYVRESLENRFEIHKSGQIVEFTEKFPWKEHLFDLEEEMNIGHDIKYAIFNDKPNSWRVQAVPVNPTSFITRKPLHPNWCGIRDEDLSEIAGIEDCIFCHTTGFIGGNKTRDGALKMAIASLEAET